MKLSIFGEMESIEAFKGDTANGLSWTVYCGDALQALIKLPSESVDCIITSPPYFWLRDYGMEGQIGLEETVEGYISSLEAVMKEAFRVLKKEGTLFLNIGDTYYSGKGESQGKDSKSKKRRFGLRAVDKSGGMDINYQRKSLIGIPWRAAIRLCENKWVLRSSIIWHRDKCLPEAVKDRPRRSYEFVFMFAKNRHYYFNREPLIQQDIDEDVWTIVPRVGNEGKINTAPFPDELVERCLSIGCPPNGTVLDLFAGSGTTLRVAIANNFNAIGIEINPAFCKFIVDSLSDSNEIF